MRPARPSFGRRGSSGKMWLMLNAQQGIFPPDLEARRRPEKISASKQCPHDASMRQGWMTIGAAATLLPRSSDDPSMGRRCQSATTPSIFQDYRRHKMGLAYKVPRYHNTPIMQTLERQQCV
ncbi:hypothetical protein LshimejAT787_0310790 [Lyophyllum shimeji]|uniref:Uncharacterized protein n=1 Tax=Lyophyllum shimeji TaxID=47721 RepID=A0A9P3UKW8_LYOSH|nr:hypothetical protein LshimejAT787_0310790 [Lyophyllum shimeji]